METKRIHENGMIAEGSIELTSSEGINWKQKLSSRKLWAMVAGLAVSVLVLVGTEPTKAAEISAIILATGSIVSYILGESYVDAHRE